MLHASAHLHHILHDLLDRRIFYTHVNRPDRDHEVQARDDVACILHQLVEVCEVILGVGVAEVDREMSERIKDCHVELVVLLRS